MQICLILDDDVNRNQVKYVFDTICLIYKGTFEYYFANSEDEIGKWDLLIYYGKNFHDFDKPNIQIVTKKTIEKRYSSMQWTVKDERLDPIFDRDIPILSGSIADNTCQGDIILKDKVKGIPLIARNDCHLIVNIDLIWNIFYHLTCYHEYFHKSCDKKYYLSFSKLKEGDKRTIEIPVVNYYIEILVYSIYLLTGVRILPRISDDARFKINLSHDLDAIEKTFLNRLKRAIHLSYKAWSSGMHLKFKASFKTLSFIPRLIFLPENYWQVKNVRHAEDKYKMNSTFNIYISPVKRKKSLFERIIDPEYSIEESKYPISILCDMGFEIGLHPGSKIFEDTCELSLQKKALEQIIKGQVSGLRVHWLNFSIRNSWRAILDAGFKYDSTFGFNDQPGFRAGICIPFYPYDHVLEEAIPILEIPLAIMDQTLFDYLEYTDDEAYKKAIEILSEVKKFNGAVSILWHQRTFSSDYNWRNVYIRILCWIHKEKGKGCTAKEILEFY